MKRISVKKIEFKVSFEDGRGKPCTDVELGAKFWRQSQVLFIPNPNNQYFLD